MKHSFLIWGIVLLFVAGTAVTSALVIYGVLPNTADDANLEYIDIYNDSCETIALAGISLRDLSGKKYTFTSGVLESGATRRVLRTESKIILNNTDETIDILDAAGNSMQQIHYATSARDVAIEWSVSAPNCHVETVEEVIVETVPVVELVPAEVPGGSSEVFEPPVSEPLPVMASWSVVVDIPVVNSGEVASVAPIVGTGTSMENVVSSGSTSSITLTGSALTGSISPESGITILLGEGSDMTGSSSGGVVSSTGSVVSSAYSTNTGSVEAPESSGSIFTPDLAPVPPVTVDQTVLVPLRLYLYDLDANGKLDRLSVEYSGTLSGVLNPEKFIIYSASGGLAGYDIETGSGVLRLLSYSGAYLVADLYEQDLLHTNLRISSSTSSELRLKSLSGLGLTNTSGIPVLPLTLTQSFGGYDSANIVNTAMPVTPMLPTSGTPSSIVNTSSSTSSSSTSTQVSTMPPRVLPDPTIVFQSWVTAEGACKTAACRINFVHETQEKFEMCRWNVISAGTGQVIDGCNPKPIMLGGSGGIVGLTLLDSAGILPFQARSFRILPYSDMSVSSQGPISTKADVPKATKAETSTASKKTAASLMGAPSTGSGVATGTKKVSAKTVASKAATAKSTKVATASPTKTGTTKTTTKKTTTTKAPATPKEPKATPIAPAYQKSDAPSDSVTIGIIGIACAGIGFCVALLRRRDAEPQ